MLKIEGRFERINRYLGRVYLVTNREKYESITKEIYRTRKVTKSNLNFLLGYNKKSENIYHKLPDDVMLNDEQGITIYRNSKGELKVQKFSYSYISLDD